MKLDHIDLDKLSVSKANMRDGRKPPNIDDILPSVRLRGVLMPILVRPNGQAGHFEIVAGRRRYHAALAVAEESGVAEPMPCAILDESDDAAALEASMIENMARLDPDEVSRWENFVRLIKEGRTVDDIEAIFGIPVHGVKQILALGNLLPRIRDLYRREEIDRVTVRHLTLASKSQQKTWLALADSPDLHCPTGQHLKAWLFGGAAIPTSVALFDLDTYAGQIASDLFGENKFFADADAFWTAQMAAVEARRARYLEENWADAVVLPVGEYFSNWNYEKTPKRKGGRVYIAITQRGEVTCHEGYLTAKEAARIAKGGDAGADTVKPTRPEVSGPLTTYIDLHRHAAVRAALTFHPHVALRLMVAHAIAGAPYWQVRPDPQSSRNPETATSLAASRAEAAFAERRRAVFDLLGVSPEEEYLTGSGGERGLIGLFLRLLDLPDAAVMDVIAIVMGETLASGSGAVEAVGTEIGVGMASWWHADAAFFALLRDREMLGHLVTEVAGDLIAHSNAKEKTCVLKAIVADHLDGTNGRTKVANWVPRWMAFPPSAYTQRGGVSTVANAAFVETIRQPTAEEPDPAAPPHVAIPSAAPASAAPASTVEPEASSASENEVVGAISGADDGTARGADLADDLPLAA